jgi:hypothetical protein
VALSQKAPITLDSPNQIILRMLVDTKLAFWIVKVSTKLILEARAPYAQKFNLI